MMTTVEALTRLTKLMGKRTIFVKEKSFIVNGKVSQQCSVRWGPTNGGRELSMRIEASGPNCVEDAYYLATDRFHSLPDASLPVKASDFDFV